MKGSPKEKVVNKQYHHGNLKMKLIETGIRYVGENGDNSLSLRKLATLCEVSHAAIYSHFKDKQNLMNEMKRYVSEGLAKSMEMEIEHADKSEPKFIAYALASGYVKFFINNPHYYHFLFQRQYMNINLVDLNEVSEYRPFEVFKKYALEYLNYRKVPKEDQIRIIIGMWSTVHGITGIAIMPDTKYEGDWIKTTIDILEYNFSII